MSEVIDAGDAGVFKTCSKCGDAKPLFDFHAQKRGLMARKSTCKECVIADMAEYKKNNPNKIKEAGLRWYRNNKEHATKKRTEWRLENPERDREARRRHRESRPTYDAERYAKDPEAYLKRKAEWRRNNPDRAREIAKRSRAKQRLDPQRVLESAIRNGVYRGITQGSKAGRGTFEILGYTSTELKEHLQRMFKPGMSWENYGRGDGCWHVDHKVPLSAHNYSDPSHIDFRRAWALSNLQPMWERENLSKKDRLFEPFQPSLDLSCG